MQADISITPVPTTFRQKMYSVLLDETSDTGARGAINRFIFLLILLNLLALLLESAPAIEAEYRQLFHWFDLFSVAVFSAEYLLRLYLAPEDPDFANASMPRLRYVTSFMGIIDLLAILPFFLGLFFMLDSRLLRVLRLLRILKLSKYNTALQDLFHAVASEKKAFASALFLLLIATIVSASLMYFAEGHNQPEHFGSIPHCIYWAVITITSGYGNVEELTLAGDIIALITGFLGVCMAAIMTGIVASAFSNQLSRKKAAFGQQLRQALADGIVTDAEQDTLDRLRRQYRLTEQQVQAMMEDIRKEEK